MKCELIADEKKTYWQRYKRRFRKRMLEKRDIDGNQ